MGSIISKDEQEKDDDSKENELGPKFPKLIGEDTGYGNEDIVEIVEPHNQKRKANEDRRGQEGKRSD